MLGETLLSLGRRAQARSALEQALAVLEGKVDANSLKLAQVLYALGQLRLAEGEAEAAQELLERAVRVHERHVGALPVHHVEAILALASAVWEQGKDRAHARDLVQRARDLDRRHGERTRAQIDDWLASH
jgi:tetratricopeptide (TPR) repeat protein